MVSEDSSECPFESLDSDSSFLDDDSSVLSGEGEESFVLSVSVSDSSGLFEEDSLVSDSSDSFELSDSDSSGLSGDDSLELSASDSSCSGEDSLELSESDSVKGGISSSSSLSFVILLYLHSLVYTL